MKAVAAALALGLLSSAAVAQPQSLFDADIRDRSSMDDPREATREVADGWFAFHMPVIAGTRSPCCWTGDWRRQREIGCSLKQDFTSYGSTSDAPLEEAVVVYTRIEDGRERQLKMVGARCPMDAGGATVTWLDETDAGDTLDWLASLARQGEDEAIAHSAMWTLSLHEDERVAGLLHRMASTADAEVAGEALFWLAESRPDEAPELLSQVVRDGAERELLEHAVFAISLLPAGVAGPMLLELARDPEAPRAARRQALFWLAHSGDDESVAALTELLTR